MTTDSNELDSAALTSLLAELVTSGSKVVMRHRGSLLRAQTKASHADLVTGADLASEQVMLDLLAARRPADGVISEERGHLPGSNDVTWVLDPLDGTANFMRGSENFGVIAGVMVGSTPIAGAMLLPAVDSLFVAHLGLGVTHNGTPVVRPPAPPLRNAMIDHSLMHFEHAAWREEQGRTLQATLAAARGVRCDHSVRYMADTVLGVLDGFVYHSLGLWDLVGTSVILGEVGVVVSDLSGAPLDLSPGSWKPGQLYRTVGASPALHRELINAVTPSQAPPS